LYLLQKQVSDAPRASRLPKFPLFTVRQEDVQTYPATDFRQIASPSMLFHVLETLCREKALLFKDNWPQQIMYIPPHILPRVRNTNGLTVLHKDGSDISVDVNAEGRVITRSTTSSFRANDVLVNVFIGPNTQVGAFSDEEAGVSSVETGSSAF
jgi:hypothetical protein